MPEAFNAGGIMLSDSVSVQMIGQYGYLAILAGTMLEGETIVLVAGFLAHQGYLSLPMIVLFAFLGSSISDQGLFFLSRYKGKKFLDKFPKLAVRAYALTDKLRDKLFALAFFALIFRFLYGLRNIAPVFLGMSSIPSLYFVFLNLLGAAIWASAFSLLGYYFAKVLDALTGSLVKYELAAVLGLAATWFMFSYIKGKRRKPDSDKQEPEA